MRQFSPGNLANRKGKQITEINLEVHLFNSKIASPHKYVLFIVLFIEVDLAALCIKTFAFSCHHHFAITLHSPQPIILDGVTSAQG